MKVPCGIPNWTIRATVFARISTLSLRVFTLSLRISVQYRTDIGGGADIDRDIHDFTDIRTDIRADVE